MPSVGGFDDLRAMAPRRIWNGVAARVLSGDKCSLGIVELDPDAVVPSHHHEHGVVAGPDGAVVFDAFAPVRADWAALAEEDPRKPRWP